MMTQHQKCTLTFLCLSGLTGLARGATIALSQASRTLRLAAGQQLQQLLQLQASCKQSNLFSQSQHLSFTAAVRIINSNRQRTCGSDRNVHLLTWEMSCPGHSSGVAGVRESPWPMVDMGAATQLILQHAMRLTPGMHCMQGDVCMPGMHCVCMPGMHCMQGDVCMPGVCLVCIANTSTSNAARCVYVWYALLAMQIDVCML